MSLIKIKRTKVQFIDSVARLTGGSWYITGPYGYLHVDLKWRQYAERRGKYTGWYKSRNDARATLAAWYDKVLHTEEL